MKAVIIDDEKRARVSLSLLLQEYCPDVEIVAECENLPEGVKAIRKYNPDLVLLDIEMPGHSGLELLDFFDEDDIKFKIIFTTAYHEYALQAFKFSAVDYLLKPINPEELHQAISRIEKQNNTSSNYALLKETMNQNVLEKIAVPDGNTILFLETKNIVYIKGEGSYAEIYCKDNIKHMICRNLKNFEEILCVDKRFIRVQKSYIVNMNFCNSFNKTNGGSLIMNNNQKIPVSADKNDLILDYFSIIKR